MEKLENKKAFIKSDHKWLKVDVLEIDKANSKFLIKKNDGKELEITNPDGIEILEDPYQRYASAEVKEHLNSEYKHVNFKKLPEDLKNKMVFVLSKGREFLYTNTKEVENKMVESTKLFQLRYHATKGTELNVQYKREQPLTKDDAVRFHYDFSKDLERMIEKKEAVLFEGTSNDGEMFNRIAYYEPRLNDIRTKPVLSANSRYKGVNFTKEELNKLNSLQVTPLKRKNAKGQIETINVRYNPKVQMIVPIKEEQSKNINVNAEIIKPNKAEDVKKKKKQSRGISV